MPTPQRGGQAFPRSPAQCDGLTLRDYFAGQALAGVFASGDFDLSAATAATVARLCYALADAILDVRDRD